MVRASRTCSAKISSLDAFPRNFAKFPLYAVYPGFASYHGSEAEGYAMVLCLVAVCSGGGEMRGTQSAVDSEWSRTVQRVSRSMFAV